jgi:hypothetical protein
MEPQDLRREVMLGEYALNPAVIDGSVVAIPHDPRQFASRKGMGHGQPHDLLLDVPGEEDIRPRLPPCMGQRALIDQAQEATAPKALQIPPQPPIVDPGGAALLRQGALTLQDRANSLIAGDGVTIANGITDEEGELQHTGRVTGH